MVFCTSMILYLLIGAVSGILAGLLGVGGGVIVVPTLAYVFLNSGFSPVQTMHAAIGTSLTSMICTSFFSTWSHHHYQRVDWVVFKRLIPGIFVGVIVGAMLSTQMPARSLTTLFALYLLYIALNLILKKNKEEREEQQVISMKDTSLKMGLGGLGIGLLSGLLGIGGGTVTVPLLTHFGLSIHRAIGTSAACGFFITIIGTMSFMLFTLHVSGLPSGSIGYVYLPAAMGVAFSSSVCAPIGSKISGKLSATILTRCFSMLLFIVAIKMLA